MTRFEVDVTTASPVPNLKSLILTPLRNVTKGLSSGVGGGACVPILVNSWGLEKTAADAAMGGNSPTVASTATVNGRTVPKTSRRVDMVESVVHTGAPSSRWSDSGQAKLGATVFRWKRLLIALDKTIKPGDHPIDTGRLVCRRRKAQLTIAAVLSLEESILVL